MFYLFFFLTNLTSIFIIFFFNSYIIYLFIYLFIAVLGLRFVRGLSLVPASGGHSSSWCRDHSSSRCAGLSLSRPLLLRGTGSRHAGSAVVAHGPSCSAACGIFPGQGSNPCPLHQQADSQPLRHQGSPDIHFKVSIPSSVNVDLSIFPCNCISSCFLDFKALLFVLSASCFYFICLK